MQQRLQTLLRTTLTREEAPEQLWRTIQQRLSEEPLHAPRSSYRFTRGRLWAGMAVAALLVLAFSMRIWFASPASIAVREIVDSQIRSQLMGASYKKIPAEPGAIRRWFHDKVEFSVVVPEVAEEGYEFLGVRLNYFLNRRVAEIAYASRHHMLSFLMFSDQDVTLKSMRTVHTAGRTFYVQKYKGYNTVLWKDGNFFCSLVSDLHLTTLLRVARTATGNRSAS